MFHRYRCRVQVAGFVRVVRNLTQVIVRAAGHICPADQPRRTCVLHVYGRLPPLLLLLLLQQLLLWYLLPRYLLL